MARAMARARGGSEGFTLVEMVIAIAVIGLAVTGVLLAFAATSRNSAEPVVSQQLVSLAQSLTEEAMLQPYTSTANTGAALGCARDAFNDVSDFNGYASSGFVCAPDGAVIAALTGYSVSISVTADVVAGVAMKKVSVTVSKGASSYLLNTYRGDLS